jgi:DNA-binding NtrC family response regulator
VVEDGVAFAKVLKRMLVARGYSCAVVHTAKEALDAIEMNTFQVVLSDVHLGAESGVGLMKKIQAISPETARILMSGTSPDPQSVDLRVAHAHLTKPFELEELLETIERCTGA